MKKKQESTKNKEPIKETIAPKTVKELPNTKSKNVDIKPKFSFNIRKLRAWIQFRRNVYERIVICMQLTNGYRHRKIIYIQKDNSFVYNKKLYVIDRDFMYYDPDINLFCLDYHESVSIPLKTTIDVDAVVQAVKDSGEISNIEHSLNPSLLADFQVSTVIEKLIKGDIIDTELKSIKRLIMLVILLCAISCIGALRILGVF